MTGNPLSAREFRENLPRQATFWVRFAYVAALVPPILWMQASGGSALQTRDLFRLLMQVQVCLVAFLAPVFTADAISAERRNLTLDLLLLSDVKPREMLSGKLVPRLAYLWMVVLSAFPVLVLWRMFGSITWSEIIAAQALVMAVGLAGATMGLFWSSMSRRPLQSLVLSCTCMAGLLAGAPLLRSIGAIPGTTLFEILVPSPLEAVEEIFSLHETSAGSNWGPWLWVACLAALVLPALPLVLAAGWIASAQRSERLAAWIETRGARLGRAMESRGFDLVVNALGPLIGKVGGPAAIHVAWREIRMSSWFGLRGILWISCAAMAAAIPIWALTWEQWEAIGAHQTVVGAELYFAGLGATVISASSIVRERESKSMEILLAAPVPARSVAWGKFWALTLAFWVLLLPPFEHLACFAAAGRVAIWTPAAFLLVAPPAVASLVAIGLFISSLARKLVFAQAMGLIAFHACLAAGLACPFFNVLVPPASLATLVMYGIAPAGRAAEQGDLMMELFTIDAMSVFVTGFVGVAVSAAIVGWMVQASGERFRDLTRRR